MSDSAHGERVIADDPPAATHNVGGGGPSPSRGSSGVAQPVVQRRDAALKFGQFVGVVEQRDAAQRIGAQRAGIAFGLSA